MRAAPARVRLRSGAARASGAVSRLPRAVSGATGWRHQLPVYSPLSPAALLAAVRAVARGPRWERAPERVMALLSERYCSKAVLLTEGGTAALTAALVGVLRDRPGCA